MNKTKTSKYENTAQQLKAHLMEFGRAAFEHEQALDNMNKLRPTIESLLLQTAGASTSAPIVAAQALAQEIRTVKRRRRGRPPSPRIAASVAHAAPNGGGIEKRRRGRKSKGASAEGAAAN